MATRGTISLLKDNGTVSTIYTHSDGYLSWNGCLLYEHYQDLGKVQELVSLGDLSSLAENVSPPAGQKQTFEYSQRLQDVCTFYGRDRGEEGTETTIHESFEDYQKNADFQEYDYIYKKNKWYLYLPEKQKLHTLKSMLKKEAKGNTKVANVLKRVEDTQKIIAEKETLDKGVAKTQKKAGKVKV